MRIIVRNLKNEVVETMNCNPRTVMSVVKECKEKYPPERFHATLETY